MPVERAGPSFNLLREKSDLPARLCCPFSSFGFFLGRSSYSGIPQDWI